MDQIKEDYCLQGLAGGDHKSFDALFLHYHPRVYCFLRGFIKDDEEASDMAQELFYRVWINRDTVPSIKSFSAYIYSIARNMVTDYYKHLQVVDRYKEANSFSEVSSSNFTEDQIYAKELAMLIDMAVELMPEQRKSIYKMSRVENLSNEEIAVLLNLNKGTVENHITHALSDLRKVVSSTLSLLLALS